MFKFEWLENLANKPRSERYSAASSFIVTVGVSAILGCVCLYVWHFHARPIGESEDWGSFGAFVAGIAGTIIAFGTLVALAFTLGLQAKELEESRELANKQFKVLAKQAFESTFFQLLQRFTTLSNDLRHKRSIENFLNGMMHAYAFTSPSPEPRAWLVSQFQARYIQASNTLDPYFRMLFQLIQFVDDQKFEVRERRVYTNFARAQLDTDELLLLFMNIYVVEGGRPGMERLVKKYRLLSHARDIPFPPYLQKLKEEIKPGLYRSKSEREAARRSRDGA